MTAPGLEAAALAAEADTDLASGGAESAPVAAESTSAAAPGPIAGGGAAAGVGATAGGGAPAAAEYDDAFVFPLSLAQERIWFVDQLTPGLAAYNIPLAVRLLGRLAHGALAGALAEVVRRHETLRTRFQTEDGRPVQVIVPAVTAPPAAALLPVVDLCGLGAGGAAEVARLVAEETAAPFDLRRGPPLRARLLRTAAEEHVLLLTVHHIVGDRWSMGVLLAEVAALYGGRPLAALPLQYADFAVWQRDWLGGGEMERQLAHWRQRLAGAVALAVPPDRRRPAHARHRGAVVRADLAPPLAAALRRLSREAGATLFMTLFAGFLVVMGSHADEDDFVVGTAVAGRARRELEGMIGFFVNTLPLRADLGGEPAFGELVARVRAVALDAFARQDVPFDRLVEEMRPPGGGGAAPPLVQVTFLLQNTPLPDLALPGLRLAEVPVPARFAKFDLSVSVVEEAGGALAAHWELDADLFLPATVERMARHYGNLLAAAAAAPERRIWDLPLAGAEEMAEILAGFNRDLRRLPADAVAPEVDAVAVPAPAVEAAAAAAPGEEEAAVGEPPAAATALAAWLCGAAALAAGLPAARVAPHSPFSYLALDSLAAVELKQAIEERTGFEVGLADLLGDGTAASLAAAILARQEERGAASESSDRAASESGGGAELPPAGGSAPRLADGAAPGQAAGAVQAAGGAAQMAAGAAQMADGAAQMADGAAQMVGAVQVAGGAVPVAGGAVQVAGGAARTVGAVQVADDVAGGQPAARPEGNWPPAAPVGSELALTPGQRALWLIHRLAPASGAYHIAAAVRALAPVDGTALRGALAGVVERHAALRTTFHSRGGEPFQRVQPELPAEWRELDASGLDDAGLAALLAGEAWRPFDLESGPLVRFAWLRGAAGGDRLLWVVHHLVADFASMAVIVGELGQLYAAAAGGAAADLPPPPVSYEQFARWQEARFTGQRVEKLWRYWQRQLDGAPAALDLPFDRARPAAPSFAGGVERARLAGVGAGECARLAGGGGGFSTPRSHAGAPVFAPVGGPAGHAGAPGSAPAAGSSGLPGPGLATLPRPAAAAATPFMVLTAAWLALLHRYIGEEDLLVGTATAGRASPRLASVVGYFANPVVLRGRPAGEMPFSRLLEEVRQTALAAFANQEMPFPLLAERLRPDRDAARSPVFQTSLVLHRAPRQAPPVPVGADAAGHAAIAGRAAIAAIAAGAAGVAFDLGGLRLESVALAERFSPFDLTLRAAETEGGLALALQYSSELFDAVTVRRLLGHCGRLLAAAVERPETRLGDLPLLAASERWQLAAEWSDTAAALPADVSLHRLVEIQVPRSPEAVAVAGGGQHLSYRELDRRAERLARRLAARGVGVEARVGLYVERSPELVVGALGILKAGAAFVPLDPELPAERLAFQLGDAVGRGGVVVARAAVPGGSPRSAGAPAVDWSAVTVVPLDAPDEGAGAAPAGAAERPLPAVPPEALAYVLYTSGSTGAPKGVMNSHRGIVNRLLWGRTALPLTAADRVAQKAPITFDVAVVELFAPLAHGACLVLARPGGHREPAYLARWLTAESVTVVHFVPSLMHELLAEPGAAEWRALRLLMVGGEAMSYELEQRILARLPAAAELYNLYGPAEAAVEVTAWRCRPAAAPRPVPLGRPVANTRAWVVDRGGRLAPFGVAGELWLGGPQVGRGYLGRPRLTAERFVPAPWSGAAGERAYRTGDRVRLRPDGEIEFLGRLDFQVKVRGVRIELGEIAAALAAQPEVAAAVVVASGAAGAVRLAAFLVPAVAGARLPRAAELRERLRRRLPEAMLPALYRTLAELPLTHHGKVDRAALLRLAAGGQAEQGGVGSDGEPGGEGGDGAAWEAPRTAVEELLAALAAELLGSGETGAISRHDNFFALGGHSLLASRLAVRVQQALGVEVPLAAVFGAGTLAELALTVESLRAAGAPPPPPLAAVPRGGPLPLSFAQERLWFLHQLEPGGADYHLAAALRLEGPLDRRALAGAAAALARRHEVLRTVFPSVLGQPVQQVREPAPGAPLPLADLAALPAAARPAEMARLARQEARRPFDLARGPLLRLTLVQAAPAEHRLLVTLHHIVADGWSVGILERELGELYAALAAERPPRLPPLPVQYADFALWQRQAVDAATVDREVSWWRQRLAAVPVELALPFDRPRPAVPAPHRGGAVAVQLPPAVAAVVGQWARQRRATPFMTLLAALHALLARYSGQATIAVGAPVANRPRAEVEPLVGCFVNTLVLVGEVADAAPFAALLARTRETALAAFAHQELPFERLVEALAPERREGRAPLFQVFLAVDGATPGLALAGLRVERLAASLATAKADLALALVESAAGIAGGLEFDRGRFDPPTAVRLAAHFAALLAAAAEDPRRRVGDLPLLAPAERAQLLCEWSDTAPPAAAWAAVHEQFAAVARQAPEAAAVARHGWVLSYGALHAAALALAGRLRAHGVGPEATVALLAERSPELVIGTVAVLAAGGAFVPLDPAQPAARLALLCADARPLVVLTQRRLLDRVPAGCTALLLDAPPATPGSAGTAGMPSSAGDAPAAAAVPAVLPAADPQQLAYVIYTSGSTGLPKGVEVAHGALRNLVDWHRREHAVGTADHASWLSGVGFDATVWELWPYLAQGATLHLPDEATRLAPPALRDWLVARQVTVAFVPTVLAAPLAELDWPRDTALRTLLTGGDRLAARPPAGLPFTLVNNYGPTEAAVVATAGRVAPRPSPPPSRHPPPTIGRPIAGAAVRLLDAALAPVPIGVAGEIGIAGRGLARGYRGRPDLTAERFVPDPGAGAGGPPGARLYRSGDLARWLPAGELDFLGRRDGQVKVRGHRIEPAEIEAVLERHPAVRQAVVLAVGGDGGRAGGAGGADGGGRRLAAWIVGEPGAASAAELRAHLRAALPEPMVPGRLTWIERLPLTGNGKVDRRALAQTAAAAGAEETGEPAAAAAGGELPLGPVEEVLAAIWADLLAADPAALGRQADFFALGGHSLLATRLVARVQQVLGVELPLAAVFAAPTLAGLAARVAAARHADAPALPPLRAVPRAVPRGELPASFAQERMWFLDRLEPASVAHHIAAALAVDGAVDVAALAQALAAVARRHEILRTAFTAGDGGLLQVIAPAVAIALPVVDLAGLAGDAETELRRLAAAEAARPFDLERGPLLRVTVVRRGERATVLLATLHHLIADGWSVAVLWRELDDFYTGFAAPRAAPAASPAAAPPPLAIQYADYAVWQRGWLRGEVLAAELDWWRERLAGLPPELPLPWDRVQPVAERRGAWRVPRRLPGAAAAFGALTRGAGATLFMGVLAAFQVLLARLCGVDDVAVGTPVANRTRAEVEGLIGLFVNTLVLRGDLADAPPFAAFLERTRDRALAAYAHQEVPFERLVEALAPVRDAGRQPLFQVMLALADAPLAGLRLGGLALAPLLPATAAGGPARFDLTLDLSREGGDLLALLELDGDRFDAATGERLLRCLAALLDGIAAAPAATVDALPLLAAAERRQVLAEWNATATPRPELCLHELFAAQAARTPEAVAASREGEHLTYGHLDRWAGELAHRLRRLGVAAESRVGVCAERSFAMLAALLAVLEAGGAFVPLDPDHPPERLAGEVAASGARLVLVEGRCGERLSRLPAGTALLRVTPPRPPGSAAAPAPRRRLAPPPPAALAYVLFTSGSTGEPKGVMVSHGAIVNHELFIQEHHPLGAADTALQITSFAFDAAIWELFTPLAAGARLVIAEPGGHRDPAAISRLAAAEGVTALQLVPSMAGPWLDDPGAAACRGLRLLACGGEPLPGRLAERILARLDVELVNFYGPTECAIDATHWRCRPGPQRRVVPIGLPLPNVRVHVLDGHLQPLPVGAPGELHAGGACLARGYVGRPELTAERFVPDPWSERPGERLYRTGDRVRRLAGGEIEYLGRGDEQVKVRGARVELGEIEAALLALPGVSEAAVVAAGEAGERRLVACVVAAEALGVAGGADGAGGTDAAGAAPLAAALRRHCRLTLPAYMVPSAFVALPRLPRLTSGKLDRRALAAAAAGLDGAAAESAELAAEAAPRTPYQEILGDLWAEVLGRGRCGLDDDFFAELGGHSLLAVQVVARVRQRLGVELPLRALFDAPTLRSQAAWIERAAAAAAAGGDAGTLGEGDAARLRRRRLATAPLSHAQERLWFLAQLAPGSVAYNMPLRVELRGRLAVPALARALGAVVERHEVLRTRYADQGGRPVQVVAAAEPPRLPVVDLRALAPGGAGERGTRAAAVGAAATEVDRVVAAEVDRVVAAEADRVAAAEAMRAFDLGRDLPLRGCLLRLADEEHRLLLTLHHIAADGWSLGLLAAELGPLYGGEALPELPLQYADYAAWQREGQRGAELARQVEYWRRQLRDLPVLELPADRPRPAVPRHRGAQVPWQLPAALLDGLRQVGRQAGATLFMTLLAGFQALLARHAGQDDFAVGTAVANRGRREIEGLIGLFVNTLALRTPADGAPDFAALVAQTRETTLAAYAHLDVPFERLVEELQPARDTRRAPLVQVLLLLQTAPLPALRLAGLAAATAAVDNRTAKLDLLVSLAEEDGGLAGGWELDADLFDAATIVRLGGHYRCLLEAAAAAPRRRLADLAWFGAAELRQVLRLGEAAPVPWEAAGPVHALLAEQAARTPAAVAVVAGERALSYGELEARAGRLAQGLRRRGVGPEVRVGLCLARGPELVVALLAVQKAGGAWVPLDPAYPPARLAAMVADAAPRVVLAAGAYREIAVAAAGGAAVWCIEDAMLAAGGLAGAAAAAGAGGDAAPPIGLAADGGQPPGSAGDSGPLFGLPGLAGHSGPPPGLPGLAGDGHAAYVIFTSGSTGRPKGVVVEEGSLCNLLLAMRDLGLLAPGGTLLAVTTLAFDIAGLELLLPLLAGGTVALAAREESADPARLRMLLADPRVAAMQATPATWRMLRDDGWRPPAGFHALCGGEALPAELAGWLLRGGAALWNLYGPTETTIWSAALRLAPGHLGGAVAPIGRPIANTRLLVLDAAGAPLPAGVAGELYIGGAGVARGYQGRPDLTAERFVPDAFAAGAWHGVGGGVESGGGRLYRTGDRVRWRAGGELEYLGRLDHQVKLRGFRIEPGEIEAVLREIPGVREAVVVVREDAAGDRRLVAYVVPGAAAADGAAILARSAAAGDSGTPAGADAAEGPSAAGGPGGSVDAELLAALRRHCQERLPAHMLPAAFVVLARLPLTPNGKLDRRALPAPAGGGRERAGGFVVPGTPGEEIVAGLWAEVLGRERVGVEDDFFADLGGHSLLATQVVARLRDRLGVELPLRSLFEAPTVRGWALRVAAAGGADAAAPALAGGRIERRPAASAGAPSPALPLSFAQERLWFLDQLTPGLAVYNLPLAVRLRGRLDRGGLARALTAAVGRHEALRSRFRFAAGQPVQEIAEAAAVPLPVVDLRGLPERRGLDGATATRLSDGEATRPSNGEAMAPNGEAAPLANGEAARLTNGEAARLANGEAARLANGEAARLANGEAARAFDLERGPLLRGVLLWLAADEHLLLLTVHHIAGDGWSLGVLWRELGALYAGEALAELPIQYPDYALWQRQWLRGEALAAQLAYWRRQLAGLPTLALPADRARPAQPAHRGGQVRVAVPAGLAAAVRRLGRAAGATLFMTLLAGFQALLGRYGGELDVAVGTAVANRRHRELEGLIGFFVNTLVLRTDVGAASFGELLTRVRAVTLDAYGHQDVPFEKLVEELRPARDTSRNPLVQVMLILQNAPLPRLALPGLELAAVPVEGRTAMLDLSLALAEEADAIGGALEYDAELYDRATVERLAGHLGGLLAAAVRAPEAPLAELPLLAAEERRQVVEEWNETAREPREPGAAPTLDALVAAQARRTPDSVAVVHGGRRLTYGDLDRAAGRLAGRLRRIGVGGGELVAVSLERSPEMVVALLGVLAAGAAYVPVDPDYPAERRAFVLADARIACGVTSTSTLARLGGQGAATTWVCVDAPEAADGEEEGEGEEAGLAGMRQGGAEDGELAYVIYTSGSTGRPKGVAIRHQSAVALVDWCGATFPREAFAGVLAGTSISFDLSVFEIFATLARGGTVVVAENLFDDAAWEGDWPITLVNTVPSLLDQRLAGRGLPASVAIVNLAGEALSGDLVERLRAALPGAVVMNLYGPSESTTYATWARIGHEPTPPIGRPVAGTRAYVLDGVGAPQPVGVPGELYLGGAGLARGYVHRAELTAERFVPDGFAGGGGRLYRTGDRVRWRPGGALEYLGRLDDQVKLRGFRIEPGEIAAALRDHPAVREAAVVLREDAPGDRRLVAYVVAAAATPAAPLPGAPGAAASAAVAVPGVSPVPGIGESLAAVLRRHCQERLPAHLVPAAFVVVERLPLTPSGKLDRRALPAPGAADAALAGRFVAPRNELERAVAAVWQEVLGVERVGIRDNFFDLGGHSLLLVSLRDRLRERLACECSLVDLFRHSTIAGFVDFLAQPAAAGALPLAALKTRAAQRGAALRGRRPFRPAAGEGE